MKFRALIVDDERPARKRIRHFLELDPEIEVIGECENGNEAYESMRRMSPDVLFLDIQMPLVDGFTLLKKTRARHSPAVIFITAYDEFAVKAFEASAADYLLKPFTRRRFEDALRKVKQQLLQKDSGGPAEQIMALIQKLQERSSYIQRVAIKAEHGITLLPSEKIDWMESEDNYVLIHSGSTTHVLRESMHAMERNLDPSRFLRIHRRFLVNVDRIVELIDSGLCKVVLQNGTKLPVSRRFKERVKRHLLHNEY